MSFSKKMEELEDIVARIEKGPMPLEDALALFEKGVKLVRECREYLSEAKKKVQLLSSEDTLVPFSSGSSDRDDGEEEEQ